MLHLLKDDSLQIRSGSARLPAVDPWARLDRFNRNIGFFFVQGDSHGAFDPDWDQTVPTFVCWPFQVFLTEATAELHKKRHRYSVRGTDGSMMGSEDEYDLDEDEKEAPPGQEQPFQPPAASSTSPTPQAQPTEGDQFNAFTTTPITYNPYPFGNPGLSALRDVDRQLPSGLGFTPDGYPWSKPAVSSQPADPPSTSPRRDLWGHPIISPANTTEQISSPTKAQPKESIFPNYDPRRPDFGFGFEFGHNPHLEPHQEPRELFSGSPNPRDQEHQGRLKSTSPDLRPTHGPSEPFPPTSNQFIFTDPRDPTEFGAMSLSQIAAKYEADQEQQQQQEQPTEQSKLCPGEVPVNFDELSDVSFE